MHETSFLKFKIRKGKWWKYGAFTIYNQDGELKYDVVTKMEGFRSVTYLRSVYNDVEYIIEKSKSWKFNYSLYENGRQIAIIDRPQSWQKAEYLVETQIAESFKLVGDIWNGPYSFVRNDEEFGIVSHKKWSAREFGIAIREGEHIPMILSVVIIMALLKANGM